MPTSVPFDTGRSDPSTRERELYALARRVTWAVRANAVAAVAFGLMLLLWPGPTLFVAGLLLGLWLLLQGATTVVEAVTSGGQPQFARAVRGVAGILLVIAGVLAIRRPGASFAVIVVLGSVCLLLVGAVELVTALIERRTHRLLRAALGALGILAGLLVLSWPGATIRVLVTVAGAALVGIGALQFYLTRGAEAKLRAIGKP
jgi:uncharacterized membrane protein HdeD (DUF308 family)